MGHMRTQSRGAGTVPRQPDTKQLARLLACLVLLVWISIPAALWAGETAFTPKGDPLVYTFFKSVISSTDGKRCDHVPSCARYAKEAVAAHGSLKGALLTCDRLIRCGGNDIDRLPQVMIGSKRHAWDPVAANVFWWKSEKESETAGKQPSLPLHFEGWE